jgi:microcompartment protein CcmK/EutM
MDGMRQIVSDSGPDDILYIHFSGHGSQAPDADGDETDDDFDETILSYDARVGEVTDITDDEIGDILSGLKTRNALIVLDSCHSGTATRSVSAIRTRMVAPDPRAELYTKKKVATRSVGAGGAEYVLMTGAASHQSALDGPVDGEFYGFFSYALGKGLAAAPPGEATPQGVHAAVMKEFARLAAHYGMTGMPEPQVEGPAELTSRAVFGLVEGNDEGVPSQARLASAEVHPADDGTVILVQAVPLGAQVGATWAIFPPGDTDFLPGDALATATVTETTGDDAVARIEPAQPTPPAGCRAVALAPPPSDSKVSIRLDRVDPEMRAQLEAALCDLSTTVVCVGRGEFSRFILDIEGGQARLYGAAGLQEVASFEAKNVESTAAKIASELKRSANAAALLSLDNPASALQLDVRIVPAGAGGTTRGVKVVAAAETAAYRIRRRGEPRSAESSLMLEIQVSQASYVTVVAVDTEGGINILFPNASMKEGFYPQGRIPGGQAIRLPDSLQAPNQAGFFWDFGPPAGLDTVRVFAMADQESARTLREYLASMNTLTTTRGAAQPTFGGLARELSSNVTTRGIAVVAADEPPETSAEENPPAEPPTKPLSRPDWTATSLAVVIQEN